MLNQYGEDIVVAPYIVKGKEAYWDLQVPLGDLKKIKTAEKKIKKGTMDVDGNETTKS